MHLFGQPVNMSGLMDLAAARGLTVVEDDAQALGAMYRGRRTGAIGHVGCLSFYNSKNLGGYGDGGMVVTNDAGIAERVRYAADARLARSPDPEVLGYNSRLDEMQAAVLRVKLRHLDAWNAERGRRARLYAQALADTSVRTPVQHPDSTHVHRLTSSRHTRGHVASAEGARSRDRRLLSAAAARHQAVSRVSRRANVSVSVALSEELLAILLYPEMSDDQQDTVVAAMRAAALALT